jgi:iron only hydrogenase large subunit-like protein/uncharacterized protein YukE
VDGSGEKLGINPNLCIGCGNCITCCPHKARIPIDDTDSFYDSLKQGEKMVVVIAPAIASFFPKQFLNFNGYLRSLGVDAMFDVSFGAELTVVSYMDYINKKNPRMVISQPCPAIVSFIQIYHPKLLPYLAPADSPMLHTIKMIRKYYPQYEKHKIAVISPCIAKRREFDETGMGDYNVTMGALRARFEATNNNLASFPSVDYTGARAERAVRFSTPGGLLDTAERFVPGIRRRTTKIEGVQTIYPYLEEISEVVDSGTKLSLLVDCLNCEKGCNGGSGTGHHKKPATELEGPIDERSAELEEYHGHKKEKGGVYKKYHKAINEYWKPNLYDRSYRDLSKNNTLKYPNETELKEVYKSMKKFSDADIYDCTACGYGQCRSMATAIFNNLNKPSNCAHYNLALLEEQKKTTIYINRQLRDHIDHSLKVIEAINGFVERLNNNIHSQSESVNESSTVTGKMLGSIKDTSNISWQTREEITELIKNTGKGQEAMKETITSVKDIAESVDGISSAIKIISVIAANTNLLSMNAAIEAAHAGDAGKGFAVVADEIRRLSVSTRENSQNISKTLSNIITGINTTSKRTGDAGSLINEMSSEINGFSSTMTELINRLSELSSGSTVITSALQHLRENSAAVEADSAEMISLTDRLRYDINFLSAMSADIVRAIEENDQEIMNKLLSAMNQKKD